MIAAPMTILLMYLVTSSIRFKDLSTDIASKFHPSMGAIPNETEDGREEADLLQVTLDSNNASDTCRPIANLFRAISHL
jgi:hypothetical protein